MRVRVRARFTNLDDGDLGRSVETPLLTERRAAIHPAPWTWLDQRHGAGVVTVTRPGEHAGAPADAAVTTVADAPIAVHTADCAPVLLTGDGTVGVVHAGWRGLHDGVLEAAIEAMAELGGRPSTARLGPCIRARCYEFGETDLARMTARYGPAVASTTAVGTPALDLAAAVRIGCERAGVEFDDSGVCTACSDRHWSHRARGDRARQALVAWLEPTGAARVSVRSGADG